MVIHVPRSFQYYGNVILNRGIKIPKSAILPYGEWSPRAAQWSSAVKTQRSQTQGNLLGYSAGGFLQPGGLSCSQLSRAVLGNLRRFPGLCHICRKNKPSLEKHFLQARSFCKSMIFLTITIFPSKNPPPPWLIAPCRGTGHRKAMWFAAGQGRDSARVRLLISFTHSCSSVLL